MYDIVTDVQGKNDVITEAQKNNYASCKCMMQLQMYKKRILKNKLLKGIVKLKHVPTKEQVEDVFTKPLSHAKFEYSRESLV